MTSLSDQELRKELAPGERLLWSGIPKQGIIFRTSDIVAIPFSLFWGGFAFFWEFQVTEKRAPFFFSLWGIPFVLVGIYIIVGRFFVDSYARSRTYYGLTNQRAIIVGGVVGRNVTSVTLRGLNEVSIQERSDRSGTVTFGSANPAYAMWGRSWPGSAKKLPPAFDAIEDVRRVYSMVQEAQRHASAA